MDLVVIGMLNNKVTALVPVFRGELTLVSALNSLLNQDYPDMDILVIDDGSSDKSWELISNFANTKLTAYRQNNMGLAATLNRGISMVQSRYLARQDQDDLVLPQRIRKQVEFLEANPNVAMVGTWAQIYEGSKATNRFHRHPESSSSLKLELLFDNPFVHSSMMIRMDVLHDVGGYSEDKTRQPPEDYELWSRIAKKYEIANIPEVLTVYREVEGSMSRNGVNPFLKNILKISSENLRQALGHKYKIEQCLITSSLYHGCLQTEGAPYKSYALSMMMHKMAAINIGGNTQLWTIEFKKIYRRQRRHLTRQFIIAKLPDVIYTSLVKIRQFVKTSI